MKSYTSYFEKDGSYNERHHKRSKPQSRLTLDFGRLLSEQLAGKISPKQGNILDIMQEAYGNLEGYGALPGNRGRAVERQIEMKAERFIRAFAKADVEDWLA
jgi:hypothetical protein